jgi:hypothetical protein
MDKKKSSKSITIDSNDFIDKKNITHLYNTILKKKNLQNESKERKKIVIDTLLNNMKKVYRSLDTSKINGNNYHSIFKQFNNICLEETEKKLTTALKVSEQEKMSKLKFERDFNSQPNREIKIMDRPIVTEHLRDDDNSVDFKNMVRQNNSFNNNFSNNFNNNSMNILGNDNASPFDKAFNMNVITTSGFNNVQMGKNTKDLQKRLADLEDEYNFNNKAKNQRPPTPEFLKPQKTKINDDNYNSSNMNNNNSNSMNMNNNNSSNNNRPKTPDFLKSQNVSQKPSQENNIEPERKLNYDNLPDGDKLNFKPNFSQNNDFLSNNVEEGNFISLDNFNNTFKPKEVVDENMSFEERLKKLQNERENFTPPENLNVSNMGNQSIDNQFIQQQSQEQSQREKELEMERAHLQQQQLLKERELETERLNMLQQQQQQQQLVIRENKNVSFDMDMYNYVKRLEGENEELKMYLVKAEEIVNELKNNDNKTELNNIRMQIKNEYNSLENKLDEINQSMEVLRQKEIEIENKKDILNQMIMNYNIIVKKQYINVETESKSPVYDYSLDLENVSAIKIVSYSLPLPKFNIDGNNNKLVYYVNEDKKEILLKKGKYNIENLLLNLNDKIKDFQLSLELDQKIRLMSTKEIKLEETVLSKNILGFDTYKYLKNLISEKEWDLRVPDRLYLYVKTNNNSENILLGILYFNQIVSNEVIFDTPVNIKKLEIFIIDENGNHYDFNNNNHNLSFRFEILSNNSSKIDIST